MNATHRRCALVAVLPILVVAACGDDDPDAGATTSAPAVTAGPTTMPVQPAPTTSPIATTPANAPTAPIAPAPSTAPESSGAVDVEMRLIAFRPERITVEAGQTIRWTQSDAGFHTITSGTVEQSGGIVTASPDGRFDSGQLATDATFELTLSEPGSYEYFCAIHPATMHGVVDVT